MKLRPLTREQVRSVDQRAIQEYGMLGLVLMENAGRGAAEVIERTAPQGRIIILCGKGNNGGDGYVIARHLDLMQRDVRIISLVPLDELSGDAAANANIAVRAELEVHLASAPAEIESRIGEADVIVDCLLGSGGRGPLRGSYAEAVRIANRAEAMRIAIDVPTGIDVDSGEADPHAFNADLTITFVAEKVGFRSPSARPFLGRIELVSIGVPSKLLRPYRV